MIYVKEKEILEKKLYDFIKNKDDHSYKQVDRYINFLCKHIYWEMFTARNHDLIQEVKGHIVYKLLASKNLEEGNLTGYLYSAVKRYLLEYDKHITYTDNIQDFENIYCYTPNYSDDVKTSIIENLENLMRDSKDGFAVLVLTKLIQFVNDGFDYNSKLLTLYLLRTTGLSSSTLFKIFFRLRFNISVSNEKTLDKLFIMYISKYGEQTDSDEIIEEWEIKAIDEFGDHHARCRGKGYELRNNLVATKKNSKRVSSKERVSWLSGQMIENLKPDQLFFYNKKFGMSYTSFKSDRRKARVSSIYS